MNVIDKFVSKENVPTVMLDQGGLIVYVNPMFEKIFESTSDEIRGKPLTAIIPSLHDTHKGGSTRLLAKEQFVRLPHTLAGTSDKSDQVIKVFILQDVPEKKNSRKQIEFLASISEHNSAPIFSVNS